MKFRELKLRKNPECPVCGENPTVTKLIDYVQFCGIRGEEAPVTITDVPEITPKDLKVRLDRGDDLFILDVREPHEYQICNLKGHLIPLGELHPARRRAGQLPRDCRPLPQRRAFGEGRRVPAAGGLQENFEPEGRHPGLVRRSRSIGAQVLNGRIVMAATKITIRNNGSVKVEGDFEVVDQEGKVFGLGGRATIALCRCGHSQSKPFCDGAHKNANFQSAIQAFDLLPAPPKP